MTRVRLQAPIADGATLLLERDLDRLQLIAGKWVVDLFGGKLTVRPIEAAENEGRDVLVVDA